MFNTIDNNQTNAVNSSEYITSARNNTLRFCIKDFIRHSKIFAVIAIAVLTVIMTNAVTTKAANGCGSTNWSTHIPDSPLGFDFTAGCNAHDKGYGTPYTQSGLSYSGWKEHVDRQLYQNLNNICDRHYSSWYQHQPCQALAQTYYEAVVHLGQKAYDSAQRQHQTASSSQYPNYILDLLRNSEF
jgi:hypothetical protein